MPVLDPDLLADGQNPLVSSAGVGSVVEGLEGRASWPYAVVAGWIRDRRDLLPELLSAAVDRLDRSSPAVDAVVGLVSEQVLSTQVERAVSVLVGGMNPKNSQAASLVASVSLQASQLLAPHLRVLWELGVNRSAYYASWPWRAAPDHERERLLAILREGATSDEQDSRDQAVRAAARLLETRDREVLLEVQRIGVPGPPFWVTDPRRVGFAAVGDDVLPLTAPGAYHLQFPTGVLRPYTWVRTGIPLSHPTWDLAQEPALDSVTVLLGGTAAGGCPTCRGPVHRLLHLPALPAGLGVTSCPGLELVTCLTCLGWTQPVMYASHATDGTAERLLVADTGANDDAGGQDALYVVEPLPEIEVRLAPTPARWRFQDWGLSNGRDNLHRVGGEPCWIQGADYPICLACSQTMSFLAQLDTLDFVEHGEWMWGSGGLAYIFWCDTCRHSATTWQCT